MKNFKTTAAPGLSDIEPTPWFRKIVTGGSRLMRTAIMVLLFTATASQAEERTAWFRDAKFGMFIHWGLYSIPAGGEWIMYRSMVPVAKYAKYAERFNPVKFNADEWVRIAKDAGMKYIVITAKHHDGFAMYGSKVSPYNIVDATPFKRDPLKELAAACAKENIRLGFYYSQAQDWHHPGGAILNLKRWDDAQKGDFDEYLQKISIPQIKELLTGYGPVANLWFDTPFEMTPERGRQIVQAVRETRPETLINSRLIYRGTETEKLNKSQLDALKELGVDYLSYGDQEIPPRPQWRDWETCMTLNRSWGFTARDSAWKSPSKVIENLIHIASKGGNFLLNVGPTAEGVIPEQSVKILRQVGAWLKVNGEAIYGTGPSPFPSKVVKQGRAVVPPPWYCTTKPGKLYIHLIKWPGESFTLTGVEGKVTGVTLLAGRMRLAFKQETGNLTITLPAKEPGEIVSVLCLDVP